jgi:hypothetical protein
MRVFENAMLRRIFGFKKQEEGINYAVRSFISYVIHLVLLVNKVEFDGFYAQNAW